MDVLEELKELGVDVDGGIRRINGNEGLYRRLLGSFVKTVKEQYVSADFADEECQMAIEKTHTIKGTSGNMSITPMYESYTEIVNLLRTGELEKARQILRDILPIQEKIVQCIEKHMA